MLRIVLAHLLLVAVAISQLPAQGNCQMMLRGMFAASCSMPCCKSKPMPSCPMVKPEAPKDFIAAHQFVHENILQPIHLSAVQFQGEVRRATRFVFVVLQQTWQLIQSSPPPTRAPPAFIHLLNA